MLIQRVNRTDPERVDLVVHNVDGSSLSLGMGAYFVGTTAGSVVSNDGASVVRLGVGALGDGQMISFAGIALQDIPADGYGLIRAWGRVDSVLLSQETDTTIGTFTGSPLTLLRPSAVAGAFTSVFGAVNLSTLSMAAAMAKMSKYIHIMNTVNISSSLPYGIGFVRAI